MGTEEKTKTLTETVVSAVIEGEESVNGAVGVLENPVVGSEMSIRKTFFCSNGRGGGFIRDSKKTGSPTVEGLTNGDSTIVVEFDDSLDNLNEKGGNCDHEKGSLAGIEGNPGEESMMIPGSERNEKFETAKKGGESHGEGKEDEGDREGEYSVGDFVWGKIGSRPWWPGRIYDPSDASDYARKYSQGEKLLVVYFGDESFSWCSTSQLKPFAEDFGEMSGQGNSSSFENAVQNAIKEMGKLGELKMTCYCISDYNRIGLDRYAVRNAGIKKGVLVPDCDLNKLLIPLNEPTYLLSMLRYVAEVVSITSLLEFTVLKSWLSAFYRAKVGHTLPVCYESVFIEGLEDKSMITGVTDVDNSSGVVEFPFGGSMEADLVSWPARPKLSQANQSLLQKYHGIADDKLYERRKMKSIAELIKEDMVVKPNNTKESFVKNVITGKLMKTSGKGKGKSNDEAVRRYDSDLFSPSGKKGRGKRSETEGPTKSKVDEDEVHRERNGGCESEDKTQNNDRVSSVGYNNTDAKEKTEKGLALGRKRGGSNLVETPESSKKKGPGERKSGGHGEEVTKYNDGVCRVGNEHTNAKAKNEKNLASSKKGTRKKRVDTQESGEKKVVREKNGDGSGGEGTEKVGVSNIEKDKNVEDEKGWASGKKRGRSKRLETQESVENKFPGEKNGGCDDEGTKKMDDVLNIGNEDANGKEETEKGLSSARKRGKGKKEEARGSDKSAEKELHSVRSGDWEGEEKIEGDNVLSVEIDDGNTKEETDKGLSSRERKKSKYLSHPFTSLKRRGVRNLNSEKDYLEAESLKIAKVARIGERMISAAGQLIRSPPVLNFSEEPKVETSDISTPNPPSENRKKITDSVQFSASTKEVLTEVKSAALNHQHLKEKSTLEMFINFISALRSSMYLNGSNYKIYHRRRPAKKRELPSSRPVTEIPESKSLRKRNEKKKQEISCVRKFQKDGGELRKEKRKKIKEIIDKEECGDASSTHVSLIVTFPSGFSLPSKNDLKALFSKFGALDETETEVLYNSSCARVVFVKSSDAEEAFNASVKESPFGPAKVSYGLRYSSDGYQNASFAPPSNDGSKELVDSASQVLFIVKEKLGLMTSMLTKSDGNMLPEVQSKLEVEVKGLLEKVNTVVAKSTTARVQ